MWCDTATGERHLSLSFLILHLCCDLLPGDDDKSLPLPGVCAGEHENIAIALFLKKP